MVVVAIIGVLAAVGVPQYAKFQSRARQNEVKVSLAAVFMSENGFKGEWNTYTTDLLNAGYGIVGSRLRYVVGQAAAACTGYTTSAGAPVEVVSVSNTWSDGTSIKGSSTFDRNLFTVMTKPSGYTGSCDATTFTAVGYGDPNQAFSNPAATGGDTWTIDQKKLLSNVVNGIN